MSAYQVNVLNIGLMLVSCVAAFLLPFELFLFSYAVLGPLHYLTQISWLHTRGYFTKGRRDYLLLGAFAVCLLLLRYALTDVDQTGWATTVVCVAFAAAAAMAFVESLPGKLAAVAAAAVVGSWLGTLDAAQILFLTFVPTVIHVYLFTAAFILHGALRGRSSSGIASLAVFVACTASFFLWVPAASGALPSEYVRTAYASFADVNVRLAEWLGLSPLTETGVYGSSAGLALMRFIAFAYTYHYLNWFSKTSIIQWHKIPRAWTAVNVTLWIGALALYAWDYRTGLLVLFGLSWLHVLLEFPLDHRTFVGIGQELAALARRRAPLPAVARAAAGGPRSARPSGRGTAAASGRRRSA